MSFGKKTRRDGDWAIGEMAKAAILRGHEGLVSSHHRGSGRGASDEIQWKSTDLPPASARTERRTNNTAERGGRSQGVSALGFLATGASRGLTLDVRSDDSIRVTVSCISMLQVLSENRFDMYQRRKDLQTRVCEAVLAPNQIK